MFNDLVPDILYDASGHRLNNGETSLTSEPRVCVSLFLSSENNVTQSIAIESVQAVLKHLPPPFEFRLRIETSQKRHQLYIFDCFAERQKLHLWVTSKVKSSNFDHLIWPLAISDYRLPPPPKLIVFDMDSTFIKIEVIDELAKHHGVGEQVAKVTESAMQGELDFSESLISRVACLEGLSDATIEKIAEQLPLSEGIEQLVERCHRMNIKIAIVSGGFTPFVQYLQNKMNLYRVKANHLQIHNNKLTGKVEGQIVDAAAKADFVKALLSELSISKDEVLTIGDGANDLKMMQESGLNIAYQAKPTVQEKAKGSMNTADFDDLASVLGI